MKKRELGHAKGYKRNDLEAYIKKREQEPIIRLVSTYNISCTIQQILAIRFPL